jgi:hypothetical protein
LKTRASARLHGVRGCLALLSRERRRVIEFVFSSVAAAGTF